MRKGLLLIAFLGLQVSAFAQYNWNALGSGTNLTVNTIAPDTVNKILYVGGIFTQAGTVSTLGIAKWDGNAYSPLGSGIIVGSGINSLLVMPNGDVVAAGSFSNIDGIAAKNIARWNGLAWSPLGTGLDTSSGLSTIKTLAIYNNELYAGGIFSNSGGNPLSFIARWDGANWLPLGTGTNGKVLSLAVYNNELYVGGTFTNAGGTAVNNIAKWDGINWTDVGGGVNYTGAITVSALQVYNGDLYAGGTFTSAGTASVNHIAKWNGVNWSDVGGGASNYTGAITVSAFQVFNGELVAGGTFGSLGSNPANFIGKWDGSSWSAMAGGMNNPVYSLAAMGDTLFAGGLFTFAGGGSSNFIAQWLPGPLQTTAMNTLISSLGGFMLFPNPAQNILWIRSSDASAFNFTLIDALGRTIFEEKSKSSDMYYERKDISRGIYFYKITGPDNTLKQEGKILFID